MPKSSKKGTGVIRPITGESPRSQVPYPQGDFGGRSQSADLIGFSDQPSAPQNSPPSTTLLQNLQQQASNACNTVKQYWYDSKSSQPPQHQMVSSGLPTTGYMTPGTVVAYDSFGNTIPGYTGSNMTSTNDTYYGPRAPSYAPQQQQSTNFNSSQGYYTSNSNSAYYPHFGYTTHGVRSSGTTGSSHHVDSGYGSSHGTTGSYHQSNHPGHGSSATMNPVNPEPIITPEQQKLMDEIEKMKMDQQKAEREHEEKMRKRREERLRKEQLVKERMDMDQKQQAELEAERFRDSQMRLEKETEQWKRESEYEARRKEQFHQEEMISLRRAGEWEREDIQEQRKREQAEFEKMVAEKDQQFDDKTLEYQNEEEERKKEIIRAQEEHKERVRQIKEELDRRRVEIRQHHEERMNQMKKQWEQIQLMLKYKVWNEVIERCWTNRLNVLRNSNRKVSDLFRRFYNEANNIQRRLDNSKDVTREIQRIVPVLNALLEALKLEAELMNQETKNLEVQWQNTRKNFVLDILAAVNAVKQSCELLENSLKNYQNLIKDGSLHSLHGQQLGESKLYFDDLSKRSGEIPTLAELKRNFSQDMQNETTPNNSREVVPVQSVIIEEIE